MKTWQGHEILNDGATGTPDPLAACRNPEAVDLTEAKYLFYEGDWFAGWSGEKLFIFDRREEFGLT
jgi:hypothetical protein